MLTLDSILVALPALAAGLGLLGYAGLLWQKRKIQQSKAQPKPIPVKSTKRRQTQDR